MFKCPYIYLNHEPIMKNRIMASSSSSPHAIPLPAPHILAIPLPAQGHINALLRLSHLLSSHGCRVTFLNLETIHSQIITHSHSQTPPSSNNNNMKMDFLPNTGYDLSQAFGVELKAMMEKISDAGEALRLYINGLLEKDCEVTCIISDMMTSCWTQDVADEFNIPRFAFLPFSQSFCLFWSYVPSLISRGFISVSEAGFFKSKEKLGIDLPGHFPLILEDLPAFNHAVDETEYFYTSFFPCNYRQLEKAEGLIGNTFYELEAKAIEEMSSKGYRMYCVGPLGMQPDYRELGSLWMEEDHCLQWLEKQPPNSVLYIAFGSITLLSVAQFEEIVLGLAGSQQQFLWVFRPDLVRHLCYDAVDYIMSETRGRGYIVKWSPQLRVLSSPAVGAFLTHCGWNSVLESIECGVPMICWPYFCDQMMDRSLIVREWKIGVQMETEEELVRREEVERVVRNLMEGDEGKEMRERAKSMQKIALDATSEGGSSAKGVKALVDDIHGFMS